MVSYNFIAGSEIIKMLSELEIQLDFQISPKGFLVEFQQIDKGLVVQKNIDSAKISYSKTNEIARGILLLQTNFSKENFEIKQECAFKDFAFSVDMSRNAVMKTSALKDIVRHISLLGYNSLMLYTEDTIKVSGEEYFGYMRGALSPTEVKEIEDYCGIFGIELVPCIQTLAHINQITRYQNYEKITDVDDILLADDERTYELLDNIFKTISECYSSKKINIGMDEAHMLGLGKHLDKFGFKERFEIMLSHLERVMKICRKYGFQPQMWSDMFFRLVYGGEYYTENKEASKEFFDKIPKDITLIYWDYYSYDYDRYNSMMKQHLGISEKIGFAGGAWKWTGFTPQNHFSLKTNESAIRACKDNKIDTFILTTWGDNGAEASVYSVLPTMFFTAEKAYSETVDTANFKTLTAISFDDFMAIDLPCRILGTEKEHNNASKFLFYDDILIGTFDSLVFEGLGKVYTKNSEKLDAVIKNAGHYSYLFSVQKKLCDVLTIKSELGKHIKSAYDTGDKDTLLFIAKEVLPNLKKRISDFYEAFKYQWHRENKSFGFEVQCARIGGLIARVDYVSERIFDFCSGNIPKIDELSETRLAFNYFEVDSIERLTYNLWSNTISPSVV